MDKKNIVLAIIGILCSLAAAYSMITPSSQMGQLAGFIIALVFGLFAGLCFAHIIAPKIGSSFGCFIYTPLEYLKKAPEKIAPVKGLIEQEKYQEAIAALNEILARKPFDPAPYLLLAEIYMDRLNDKNQAAGLIEKYFSNSKIEVFPENVEMLMRYSDICLEQNRHELAIALFEAELNRKGYTEPERKGLGLRLEALIARKSQIPATFRRAC
jgi:tetratricopeptide (TPR) repeat protein